VEVRDAVEMLVSELATNCVRHTESPFTVSLDLSINRVRVEVSDSGEGKPEMRFPAPSDPTGRGLRIVDVLSRRWGVTETAGGAGKTVWFEVPARAAGHVPERT
jgi:anti-sigma regulatory factor (Ser/Thr protein kinase)